MVFVLKKEMRRTSPPHFLFLKAKPTHLQLVLPTAQLRADEPMS